jgi:hypothetical protein
VPKETHQGNEAKCGYRCILNARHRCRRSSCSLVNLAAPGDSFSQEKSKFWEYGVWFFRIRMEASVCN